MFPRTILLRAPRAAPWRSRPRLKLVRSDLRFGFAKAGRQIRRPRRRCSREPSFCAAPGARRRMVRGNIDWWQCHCGFAAGGEPWTRSHDRYGDVRHGNEIPKNVSTIVVATAFCRRETRVYVDRAALLQQTPIARLKKRRAPSFPKAPFISMAISRILSADFSFCDDHLSHPALAGR